MQICKLPKLSFRNVDQSVLFSLSSSQIRKKEEEERGKAKEKE
jgi:hypothetical protein